MVNSIQQKQTLTTMGLLLILSCAYTLQSTIGGIYFYALPGILRDAGQSTENIGFIYILMLPWVLKFLWAPKIEHYRQSHPQANRHIIVAGYLLIIASLLVMACINPITGFILLFTVLMLQALVCSGIDNAIDGFAIDQLKPSDRGLANSVQIGSGYLGMIIGGGVFLIVFDRFGWTISILIVAAFAMLLLTLLRRIPNRAHALSKSSEQPSLKSALRPPIIKGLVVILIYQASLRLAQGMNMPFLVDKGINLSELGLLIAFGNSIASLIAVALSGFLVKQFGEHRMMVAWLLLQIPVYLGFVWIANQDSLSLIAAAAILISQSMVSAAAFVALYTAMMRWAHGSQAGVDFSILQCADAGIAMLAGFSSGILVAWLGYSLFFSLVCFLAVAALVTIPILLNRQQSSIFKEEAHQYE